MIVLGYRGLALLKHFEQGPNGGPALVAYADPHVWTIGYGHTGPDVHEGDTCTHEEAENWLREDCHEAEKIVGDHVTCPLAEYQADALVCFAFNIGDEAFVDSTLLKLLNSSDTAKAAQQFDRWNHDNGKVVAGLTNRRAAERKLFEKGQYP